MHRHPSKASTRHLSVEDRKALDVLLDHGPGARDSKLARHTPVVPPRRITAVSKVLDLLSELPEIDPPKDLVARTMQRIDRDVTVQVEKPSPSAAMSTGVQVH